MSMEFYVNEKGCYQLQQNMVKKLQEISKIVGEIEGSKGKLVKALGENDAKNLLNQVGAIKTELEFAEGHLKEMLECMSDYIDRVKQIHIVLNG